MTISSSWRARTPDPTDAASRRRLRRRRAAGVAVGVVAAVGLVVPTAHASHYQASLEGSTFQIDNNANFKVDPDTISGGADTGPLVNQDWNSVAESKQDDVATGTNDNSYSGGVKEDTLCPGTTTGSIPNNKSDLKTFGVYTEPGASPSDPGYLHLYWTRVSDPSGTTLMDFEFNQSGTVCAAGAVNKARTVDDLLIEYSIVQGGARAVITVRKWTGTQWGPATTFAATDATGTTNTTPIPANETGGVSAVPLQARTFGEASIDLDAIFDEDKCTSFGSAMLKSRSSDSFTSQLKDFIAPLPINLSNCAQVIIRKQTDPDGATTKFGFTKSFATDPASANTFELADGESYTKANVLLGSGYTVVEDTIPAGWKFDSIDCSASSGVTGSISGATVTFALDATTDKLDCTYNNSRLRGSIQVEKVVTGTDDRIDGASFAIDEDGDPGTTNDRTSIPEVSGEDGLFCIDDLLFGTYKVLETHAPDGYSGAGPAQSVVVDSASTCADREADDVDATFQNKALPTISTQATPTVVVGQSITDTATLAGGYNPTGTITFKAYSNDTCTTEVFSDVVTVDAGNGDYTSDAYTTTVTGTIYWIASYSGDGSNAAATGACKDAGESSAVTKKGPAISTSATPSVTVGEQVSDTATLSGGQSPTGTITFRAYSNDTCTTQLFTDTATVSGNGDYTSDPYTTLAAGTIYWIASYGGDANNEPATGACKDAGETSVVAKKLPAISTSATPTVTVGQDVTDTATLSGGFSPTGTITFRAYSNDTCTTQLFTDTATVSGNGDYTSDPYTTTAAGTIYWIASYGGDANNQAVSGACKDAGETSVVGKKQPTITTLATPSVTVGETITDTATLSGGFNPTGTITFKAYSNDTCTAEVFSDQETVDAGNGGYTSDAYTTTATGTIYWIASYSGDANNLPASGACKDAGEASVVNKATPGIDTTPRLLPNDSALLSGGFGTLTGTISFALFASADCSGDAIYEEGPISVNGFGPYVTTNDSVFITADGTYSWEVAYSGDGNNNGAFSSCTLEQQVVDFTPL